MWRELVGPEGYGAVSGDGRKDFAEVAPGNFGIVPFVVAIQGGLFAIGFVETASHIGIGREDRKVCAGGCG